VGPLPFRRVAVKAVGVFDAHLDLEAVFLEQFRQPGDRLALFVGDLRVRVNITSDSLQLGPERIEPGADLILQLADRRMGD